MIEYLLETSVYVVAIGFGATMVMIRKYPSKAKVSASDPDDRMVAAFLHAEGPSTINQMSESCSTPHRTDINQSLVRLCARGVVERQDDSSRKPVFKIAEGAEVLIDE